MELGAFVDYCDQWSKVHNNDDGTGNPQESKRLATQADWDAFMG